VSVQTLPALGENELLAAILDPAVADNPLEFVLFAFPWGKQGTPLERFTGPRTWQVRVLLALHEFIVAMQAHDFVRAEDRLRVFKLALSSGRGIGKSALVAWIVYWFMSTRIGGTVIISANTENQLKTVTWGELGKWHTMLLNKHWFEVAATSIKPQRWFEDLVKKDLQRGTKYYYCEAKLWSEENPDAYAGVHNPLGILLLFDEASGIPAPIWTVAEGYFTEPVPDRYWLAFSNPRQNKGAFFECFHRDRDNWRLECIDSREVEGTDKAIYAGIIEKYGAESDEAKVEVYGQFPSIGDNQFISAAVVSEAMRRPRFNDPTAPVVIGVDVARFGSDKTVLWVRKGRDRVAVRRFAGLDTMQVVGRVIEAIGEFKPDLTIVDEGGLGAGVLDRLVEQHYKVRGVNFGSRADDACWKNKRSEMWGKMKEWLKGASLGSDGKSAKQDDKQLTDDLAGPSYKIDSGGAIMLESKDAMKRRGVASPDEADALAITFAYPVARRGGAREAVARTLSHFTRRSTQIGGNVGATGWMG
jgi:hypothetical protein